MNLISTFSLNFDNLIQLVGNQKHTSKPPFFLKLISGILSRVMILKLRHSNKKSGKLFKDYCEKVAIERKS